MRGENKNILYSKGTSSPSLKEYNEKQASLRKERAKEVLQERADFALVEKNLLQINLLALQEALSSSPVYVIDYMPHRCNTHLLSSSQVSQLNKKFSEKLKAAGYSGNLNQLQIQAKELTLLIEGWLKEAKKDHQKVNDLLLQALNKD